MIKDYLVRILQVIVISVFIIVFSTAYIDYFNVDHKTYDDLDSSFGVRIQLGRNPKAINRARGDNTLLVSANSNLLDSEVRKIPNEVYGDTLLETPTKSYLNNFADIVVTSQDGTTNTYQSSLYKYAIDIIYSYPIRVISSFVEDDKYHSLSRVYVESTLGYKVQSTILTQISDGKRIDMIINLPVERFTYDKANDKYYLFYIPRTSKHAIDVVTQVKYVTVSKNDENNYIIDYKERNAGFSATVGNIESISKVTNGQFFISYSKRLSYGELSQIHYYLNTFNISNGTATKERVLDKKEIKPESDINVVDTIEVGENLYVFYDDLSYYKFNVYDGSHEGFIITNTGVVDEIQFSSNNKDIFMLSLGDDNFKLFKLHDGIIEDTKTVSRSALGLGLVEFYSLLDFSVR